MKLSIRKIETIVPYDIPVTSIGELSTKGSATLEITFINKQLYEIDGVYYILTDVFDNTGEMKALFLCNDKDYINNIRYGLRYRISGLFNVINDDDIEVKSLPFINDIKDTCVFFVKAMQCYDNTFCGVDISEFNCGYDLSQQYSLVEKYTNYLNGINQDNINDIKVTVDGRLIYLLDDSTVHVNDRLVLDNIKYLHCTDSCVITSIGLDNTITCLSDANGDASVFINDNNYQYKKILLTEFGIIALRYDGVVRYFGDMFAKAIDYSLFVDVDDIKDIAGKIVVIKGSNSYSLFYSNM